MTTNFLLVPVPRWYFADNSGRPLGGGYMSTFRNMDRITPKPVYTDQSGFNAWPNPVFFNANGMAPGPFFWADDELYYVEIRDAANNLMFSVVGYGPAAAGSGGGGGTVTINNFLENYVVNNDFTSQNYSTVVGAPPGINTFLNIQSGTVIAASNHHGLVKNSTGFASIPFSGPDIMFVRSNNSSTDNLRFSTADFNPGLVPLTGDVTPEFYIDLECTSAGTETLKAVQFPIALHVKNLEQQVVTAMVWAKGASGTQNLTMNLVQYFGTGSATTPVVTALPITASPLTNSWQPYVANLTSGIPSIAGKTLGIGADDALYLQICFPTTALFNIYFTKPKFYLGTLGSVFAEFANYDYVDRIINAPRTGDIKCVYSITVFPGWVQMNDLTIGNAGSGATNRANIDTWPLYSLLWNNVSSPSGNTLCIVSGGLGASAIADFGANKPMQLPVVLGRALASAGTGSGLTARALASIVGEENHTLTIGEMPTHHHAGSTVGNSATGATATTLGFGQPANTSTSALTIVPEGGGLGHNTMQPTTFMNVFIKL